MRSSTTALFRPSVLQNGFGPRSSDDDVADPVLPGETEDGVDDVLPLVGEDHGAELFGQGQRVREQPLGPASMTVASSEGVWT